VRAYSRRDGRLNLSLMADGGILVWEPLSSAEVIYSNTPDPALERAILRAQPGYRGSVPAPDGGLSPAGYVHGRVDLDVGGAPATDVRQMFDGRTSLERERIPAKTGTPAGLAVLSGDPVLRDGAVLEPQR
jgi:hypothetical protein